MTRYLEIEQNKTNKDSLEEHLKATKIIFPTSYTFYGKIMFTIIIRMVVFLQI